MDEMKNTIDTGLQMIRNHDQMLDDDACMDLSVDEMKQLINMAQHDIWDAITAAFAMGVVAGANAVTEGQQAK